MRIFLKQNKIEEAKSCLNNAKRILSKDIDVVLNKSDLLYEMGKREESIECINTALKLNPNDINLLDKKEEMLNKLRKTKILTF